MSRCISIRVSEKDYNFLVQRAEAEGSTVTAVVCRAAMSSAEKSSPDCNQDILRELNQISTQTSQLTQRIIKAPASSEMDFAALAQKQTESAGATEERISTRISAVSDRLTRLETILSGLPSQTAEEVLHTVRDYVGKVRKVPAGLPKNSE